LGRNPATLGRELRRNSTSIDKKFNNSPKKKKHYLPHRAEKKYQEQRIKAKTPFPLKNIFIYQYTTKHLEKGWSPELISGRPKEEYSQEISHECIYQFIHGKYAKVRDLKLWEYLPRKHQKRRKKHGRKGKRVLIPNRIDISLRPEIVEKRGRYGDWEEDTIFGRGKGAALATFNERKSRYVVICKLGQKTAKNMMEAATKTFLCLPEGLRETLTFDNGSENMRHEEITLRTAINVYFARAYHSWERGGNERINGLIRRYYPKKTNFDEISEAELQHVQDQINHRPMKCLGFNPPP